MKKLFTFVFTMLLGASLAFAQATGGSTDTKEPATSTKGKKHKSHKGGKKHKKGEGATTGTTAPK
jgi:hypothetical protein